MSVSGSRSRAWPPHHTLPPWRWWQDQGVLSPTTVGFYPHPHHTPKRCRTPLLGAGGVVKGFYLPWVWWEGRRHPWLRSLAWWQWDSTEAPSQCSAGSAVSLQPAGGFMPQLRNGEAGAGAEVVLGGWSTAPFPSLPSRLDAVMMDGRRAVAPLGPPPVPKQGLGCPRLGRDIFLGVSLSLHITDLSGGRWGLPQAKPLSVLGRHHLILKTAVRC